MRNRQTSLCCISLVSNGRSLREQHFVIGPGSRSSGFGLAIENDRFVVMYKHEDDAVAICHCKDTEAATRQLYTCAREEDTQISVPGSAILVCVEWTDVSNLPGPQEAGVRLI